MVPRQGKSSTGFTKMWTACSSLFAVNVNHMRKSLTLGIKLLQQVHNILRIQPFIRIGLHAAVNQVPDLLRALLWDPVRSKHALTNHFPLGLNKGVALTHRQLSDSACWQCQSSCSSRQWAKPDTALCLPSDDNQTRLLMPMQSKPGLPCGWPQIRPAKTTVF